MSSEASDPDSSFSKDFPTLQQAVLKRRPVLREILRKRGTRTLFDYSREAIISTATTPSEEKARYLGSLP